jgi:hypothetical protein
MRPREPVQRWVHAFNQTDANEMAYRNDALPPGVGYWVPAVEVAMCHASDYWMFQEREQKKAEETKLMQERRAAVIGTLLRAANKESEETKPEEAPVKEVAPAK